MYLRSRYYTLQDYGLDKADSSSWKVFFIMVSIKHPFFSHTISLLRWLTRCTFHFLQPKTVNPNQLHRNKSHITMVLPEQESLLSRTQTYIYSLKNNLLFIQLLNEQSKAKQRSFKALRYCFSFSEVLYSPTINIHSGKITYYYYCKTLARLRKGSKSKIQLLFGSVIVFFSIRLLWVDLNL